MRRKVHELANRGEADLIFVTALPGCASLVGAWAKRRLHLPFVLDYQDPWVFRFRRDTAATQQSRIIALAGIALGAKCRADGRCAHSSF
jgi:hypothetical protein